ncbi:hypothetical protein Anapl_12115 [Anas platyrhynchos]|uniref:Uncharacterized protein n=1 Tax=Anas platyrhynchos TaxID=8839 RepID=R0LSP1_ANAPL|nr:hypothetical protein Anapl_12115 [Anas platyrhynchos]
MLPSQLELSFLCLRSDLEGQKIDQDIGLVFWEEKLLCWSTNVWLQEGLKTHLLSPMTLARISVARCRRRGGPGIINRAGRVTLSFGKCSSSKAQLCIWIEGVERRIACTCLRNSARMSSFQSIPVSRQHNSFGPAGLSILEGDKPYGALALAKVADRAVSRKPTKADPATQIDPSELQELFQETSANVFRINSNGAYNERFPSRLCAVLLMTPGYAAELITVQYCKGDSKYLLNGKLSLRSKLLRAVAVDDIFMSPSLRIRHLQVGVYVGLAKGICQDSGHRSKRKDP